MYELIAQIRALADKMDSVAEQMKRSAYYGWNGELYDHAIELAGAAKMSRTWADGLANNTAA